MLITVRQSGGFAGNLDRPPRTIDTSTLDKYRAAMIARSVDELSREMEQAHPVVGADMLRFEIEVHDDQGRHRTIQVVEEDGPGSLPRPLRELLNEL